MSGVIAFANALGTVVGLTLLFGLAFLASVVGWHAGVVLSALGFRRFARLVRRRLEKTL